MTNNTTRLINSFQNSFESSTANEKAQVNSWNVLVSDAFFWNVIVIDPFCLVAQSGVWYVMLLSLPPGVNWWRHGEFASVDTLSWRPISSFLGIRVEEGE
jgi:hypothetical protein